MAYQFIDTVSALSAFLDSLPELTGTKAKLFIDLEGNNLSRHGTLSLVTILVEPLASTYLIDVTTLGQSSFSAAGEERPELSLKYILESPEISKVFFDIRNDSDALYSLHGISVAGIHDLQLMELAARSFSRRTVNGLARCIEHEADLTWLELQDWNNVKEQGKRLFAPERGGSYTVFDQRPLSEAIRRYCTQDVVYMPVLYRKYMWKLCDAWWFEVIREGEARVRSSQSKTYDGKGKWKAYGPPKWQSWRPSAREMHVKNVVRKIQEEVPPPPVIRTSTISAEKSVSVNQITQATKHELNDSVASIAGPSGVEKVAVKGDLAMVGKDSLAKALESLSLRSTDDRDHLSTGFLDDSDEDEVVFATSSYSAYDSYDDEGPGDDFTACDKECGYCGRCMY